MMRKLNKLYITEIARTNVQSRTNEARTQKYEPEQTTSTNSFRANEIIAWLYYSNKHEKCSVKKQRRKRDYKRGTQAGR